MRAPLAVLLLTLAPSPSTAEPVKDASRLAVQAGWRYAANTRFRELAEESGHPVGPYSGAPAMLAVFAFNVQADLEVAVELGLSRDALAFRNEPAGAVWTVPATLALRWSPITGHSAYPYVGGGLGYSFSFVSGGPAGYSEAATTLPFVMAGGVLELGRHLALVVEYRFSLARIPIPGVGSAQVGGNLLTLGFQWSFPPEPARSTF